MNRKAFNLAALFTLTMWLGVRNEYFIKKKEDIPMSTQVDMAYPPVTLPSPVKAETEWGVLDLRTGEYINHHPLTLRDALRLEQKECPTTGTYPYIVQPWNK